MDQFALWRQEPVRAMTRKEAEDVVELMLNTVSQYEVVSLSDLLTMLQMPSQTVDHKWGWTNLATIDIQQVRDGYLIILPPMESI